MLLEDAGFFVETCEDGQAALSRASSEPFDVVVASLQDKTLGGFELSSALRAHPATQSVRIVLTSADPAARLATRATEVGAQALVRKGSLRDAALTQALKQLA
jgi:two-component system chemotaxis sensor kinase CheA